MEELVNTGFSTNEMFSTAVLSSEICFGRDCNDLLSFDIPSLIFSEMPFSTADAIFPPKTSTTLEQT